MLVIAEGMEALALCSPIREVQLGKIVCTILPSYRFSITTLH